MDLSFTAEEHAFAQEVRTWLAANVDVPPRFESIAAEVEAGRITDAKTVIGLLLADRWLQRADGP